jgi:outer membrane lipoprotein SlyB
MNTRTRTLIASLCILASGSAVANDAVWGALLGGGAGAAIGGSVSGRNGAIVGGAIGAAAGAVIASDSDRAHTAPIIARKSCITRRLLFTTRHPRA